MQMFRLVSALVAVSALAACSSLPDYKPKPQSAVDLSGDWTLEQAVNGDWTAELRESLGMSEDAPPPKRRVDRGAPRNVASPDPERIKKQRQETFDAVMALLPGSETLSIDQRPTVINMVPKGQGNLPYQPGQQISRYGALGQTQIASGWEKDVFRVYKKTGKNFIIREGYRLESGGRRLVIDARVSSAQLEDDLQKSFIYRREPGTAK